MKDRNDINLSVQGKLLLLDEDCFLTLLQSEVKSENLCLSGIGGRERQRGRGGVQT